MIRTARLVLRPLRPGDLDALHAITTDPRAMRYWDRPAFTSLEETHALLAAFLRDAPEAHLEYAVDLDGAFIGRVGMWKRYEIGYLLHPDHWGRGYGTEAVLALITEVWARFPEAVRLTAELDPRNTGSVRLLENCGFVRTGLVEKNFDYGGVELCDTAYYEVPRP